MVIIARCDCSGKTCNCLVVSGPGITVTGSGLETNPYVVSMEAQDFSDVFRVSDTTSLDLVLNGSGTVGDPLILSGHVSARLLDLTDVEDPSGPLNGEVPTWVGGGTGHWEFRSPAPINPGAINSGAGILGDGTVESPIRANVSGTWGVGNLGGLGANSLIGLEVYIDSQGKLRARPGGTTSIDWTAITNKPTTFPSTWTQVTGKPVTFPPQIGTTSTTAAAGDHTHPASAITTTTSGQSVQAKLDSLTTSVSAIDPSRFALNGGLTGRAVMDISGTNSIGLRWNGSMPVLRVDATEWELYRGTDVQWLLSQRDLQIGELRNSRAVAIDDINQARYSRGTYKCHQQAVSSGTWYSVWVNGAGADYQFARNTSALKYKENVRQWNGDPAAVLAIQPVVFDRKAIQRDDAGNLLPGRKDEFGLIADDVVQHLPELGIWARTDPDGTINEDAEEQVDGLRYDLLPVAQQVVLRDHENRIKGLEAQVAELRAMVAALTERG